MTADGMSGWPRLTVALPAWVEDTVRTWPECPESPRERMALVIDLARENVARGGGPFAAAIFELPPGRLLAPGVNLVLQTQCSVLHAEVVAIILAQQVTGSYSLRRAGGPTVELVTSAEPCAMCLGAVHWSGISALVCGARDADVRDAGFDEGPKPATWVAAFRAAGITVTQDVCRAEARAVLRMYRQTGRPIYNG